MELPQDQEIWAQSWFCEKLTWVIVYFCENCFLYLTDTIKAAFIGMNSLAAIQVQDRL